LPRQRSSVHLAVFGDERVVPLSTTQTIGVVFSCLNPGPGLRDAAESLLGRVDGFLFVDNGSEPALESVLGSLEGASAAIVRHTSNTGVAAALNEGVEWATSEGFTHMLALDQDSRPANGMVSELIRVYRTHHSAESLAIVAPAVRAAGDDIRARYLRRFGPAIFERVPCNREVRDDVTSVITSGSLVNLSAHERIGPFREDFFVDYVDTEYCLRAQAHGYRIAVACKAVLYHRLGKRQHNTLAGLAFYPTFHSPERWYYIARNRIPMIRMYGWKFPHWFNYEVMASTYGFLRMLAFEDRRREKLMAVMKGTVDGLLGRLGPGPLGAP